MAKNLLAFIADLLADSPALKAAMSVLARFADDNGAAAKPTLRTIMALTGFRRRAVLMALKDAAARGLVARLKRTGYSTLYVLRVHELAAVPHFCLYRQHKPTWCESCAFIGWMKADYPNTLQEYKDQHPPRQYGVAIYTRARQPGSSAPTAAPVRAVHGG
jgi:hypothetical protein